MYVVSFTDYRPTPRYDGVPWSVIHVEESDNVDGPWTQIEVIDISTLPDGVDTDPSEPLARSFTTDNATLQEGFYRVSFLDANGDVLYFAPIQNVAPATLPWTPSIQEVADQIVSRTRDQYGNEIGTFNATTRPTDTQVMHLIVEHIGDVANVIGTDIPSELWEDASTVVAERVAMQIELDYFPEQVNTDRSPYKQLKEEYEEDLSRLSRQVQVIKEGGDPTQVSTAPSKQAVGSFPDTTKYPPYGLSTRW